MSTVRFDLKEMKDLSRKLKKAAHLDMTGILRAIGVLLVSSTTERFSQGLNPEGMPWIPSRRASEAGGKTLVNTSRLEKSVNFFVNESEVEVGTNLEYAAIHQHGGTITPKNGAYLHFIGVDGRDVFTKSVKIPKRSYLGINTKDKEYILGIVKKSIFNALTEV